MERWVSAREAAEMVGQVCGTDRETGRRVLKAGVAGEPVRTRSAHLYPAAAVEALADRARHPVGLGEVDPLCLDGVFVARLSPRRPDPGCVWRTWRGADMSAPEDEQRRAASAWWRISLVNRIRSSVYLEQRCFLPFLGTVGGFVVLGADIVGVDRYQGEIRGRERGGGWSGVWCRFHLQAPGAWFDAFRGGRLEGPTGGPWYSWPTEARGRNGEVWWRPRLAG